MRNALLEGFSGVFFRGRAWMFFGRLFYLLTYLIADREKFERSSSMLALALTHAHPLKKAMSIPHGLSRFTVHSLSFKIHFPILIYDRAFLSLMLLRLQDCGSLPSRIVLRCMLALRLLL